MSFNRICENCGTKSDYYFPSAPESRLCYCTFVFEVVERLYESLNKEYTEEVEKELK